ncbi:MAG: response regulator [Bacteroidetes bacterium]|nr:response regulator [Bacteroidota bacterium]
MVEKRSRGKGELKPRPAPNHEFVDKRRKARKVLVVDDEEIVTHTVSLMLTSAGYDAVIAHNGWEALRIAQEENVGLVLCDLFMPGMSGWQVIEHLRPLLPETPIILFTGFMEDLRRDLEGRIEKLKIADVLFKPVRLQQLVEAIAPHVGHKDMRSL